MQAIVKLQKAGWGRPPREPVSFARNAPDVRTQHGGIVAVVTPSCSSMQTLDEETEKAVLAYYHRKQQEQEVSQCLVPKGTI